MNSDFRSGLKQLKSPFFEVFVSVVCVLLLLVTKLNGIFFYISNPSIFLQNLTLFLTMVISSKIVLMSFSTYPIIDNNSLLFGGAIFLLITVLDLPRILDFSEIINKVYDPGIPMALSLSARLLNAIGFAVALRFVSNNKKEYKKSHALIFYLSVLVFSLIFIVSVFHFELGSLIFTDSQGITVAGKILAVLAIVFNLYSICHIYKEYNKNEFIYRRLFCIFLYMIFANISLINIKNINDFWAVLCNVFLMCSYILVLDFYYIYGIKRPHMLLLQAKEERNRYIREIDELVEKRTLELRTINEKLLVDQEIARRMQFSMLPKTLPRNDYATFSSSYVPADNLSGDFYNVFKIDDVRFGICIGDVSGHGVSAAMLTVFIFQKLQSLMEEKGGESLTIPSVVLSHLYDSLNASNFDENLYAVMIYGVFNSETGIFSYASGGLNTVPLRVRPDGSIQELDNSGFAICKLGNFYKPRFVNNQILLFPKDKLVLYTDGLVEARNSKNEEYSLPRLKKVIQEQYKWGVEHLTEAITKDVQEFIGQKPSDDITLLILDVLPPF
ncbi:MAG: SpoIIE family protein phosphatase [Clostridiaceae bacterium]|nr:SpoIIE family protein phosphatase [Clostridiaceae bacterium]